MSDLEWYPADWVDESCPPSGTSPEAFIVPVMHGFELGYIKRKESDELWNQPLKVGDVVQFVSCDRLPDVEATLRPDGTYDLHGTIDPSHNVVIVDGDIDTLQGSFVQLIESIKTQDDDFSPRAMIFEESETEKRVALQFANWSDPQPFLFEIVDGKPTFSAVPQQKN